MRPILWLVLLCTVVGHAAKDAPATSAASDSPTRFDKDILAFEALDKANPPPQHGLLLTGASTFRRWTDALEVFKAYPAINRGFGSSKTTDVLHYMDRITLPYHPRVIAYHCGSNDLNYDKATAAEVAGRVRTYWSRVRAENPDCVIILLSITHAPSRRAFWDEMKKTDAEFQKIAQTEKGVTFLDINPALNLPDGEPREGAYVKDNLHPSEQGYKAIAKLLLPAVAQAWQQTAPAFSK